MKAFKRLIAFCFFCVSLLGLSACGARPQQMNVAPPSPTPEYIQATPEITPIVIAEPTPAPEPVPTVKPTPDPNIPIISIENATAPGDMQQYAVADIRGLIKTSVGQLAYVWARLSDANGNTVQEYSYMPYSPEFSLGGTVNVDMTFGILAPGNYTYSLSATAQNGDYITELLIIEHNFRVYGLDEVMPVGGTGSVSIDVSSPDAVSSERNYIADDVELKEYSIKNTYDSNNSGQIWNYFIGQFSNPYAAAAILSYIDSESECDPMRVDGDPTGEHYFSSDYTALVDAGDVSRDDFINVLPREDCGHGYGLLQWRGEDKGELYDLAAEYDCSIGELGMQCDYIMLELTQAYPLLIETLLTASDASSAVNALSEAFGDNGAGELRLSLAIRYLNKYAIASDEQ